MKIILIISLAFLSNLSFAQFAIISDTDGHCNVRTAAATGNNIITQLENGHLVYSLESKGNWANIDYDIKGKEGNGYVYHDRLTFISAYETLDSLSIKGNVAVFGKDSIKVTLSTQKFNKSNYRFSYYKDASTQIKLINGKRYWGRDGGMPTEEYKSISITIGKKKIALPKAALENLFEPSLYNTEVNYDRVNDILYIQSMNSDGAGNYEVIWKIEKGIYKNRFIAYGF